MPAARIPDNEGRRLAALLALRVLDTGPEERFDRIARMAQKMFDVPMATISLVDFDRQWFKSHIGMSTRETPRSHAFCAHTILENEVLVVEDARRDSRFSDSPLVLDDPQIRFYAGAPISAPGGELVGALCVIDREARSASADDIETLRDLAAVVESELAASQLAVVDELTQLLNRRGFDLTANHLMTLASRSAVTMSLVLADLDDMKSINDSLGHEYGDQALRDSAELLTKIFRGSDVVARIGGDEFAIAAFDTSEDFGELASARLKEVVDIHNGSSTIPVRLSLSVGGVTREPHDALSVDEMLRDADAAMYSAKRRSRADRLYAQASDLTELDCDVRQSIRAA
ncbi:MAG: sensor domain-containing diguanylate cyclase [Actinobacteria bacterium]|nr:sensor domain-containing diguanylate cyclase [Actinomycetota bacterium]